MAKLLIFSHMYLGLVRIGLHQPSTWNLAHGLGHIANGLTISLTVFFQAHCIQMNGLHWPFQKEIHRINSTSGFREIS